MTSSTILAGPCAIAYKGALFYSKGDVTVKAVVERFDIKVDGFPKIHQRDKDRRYEISFDPAGQWDNLSVMFPYSSTVIGSQIFANDTLTIWTREAANNKRVYSNAAVTKCPGILGSVADTILGGITFTCILKDGAIPGDSDAYMVQSTDTFPSETVDVSKIITPVYARSWGSSPWNAFMVDAKGIVYDFPIETRAQVVDGLGTVNMVLVSKSATGKFTPMGLTEAQVRAAVGAHGVFGSAPTVNDLILTGTGVHITLYKAQLHGDDTAFGEKVDRLGEITATATQTFTGSAANPIYRIAAAAP